MEERIVFSAEEKQDNGPARPIEDFLRFTWEKLGVCLCTFEPVGDNPIRPISHEEVRWMAEAFVANELGEDNE